MAGEPDISLSVGAQLAHATDVLAAAGTPAPRDEACALLSALLDVPVALLLAQPQRELSVSEAHTFALWAARRAEGEAISHITSHVSFMGLDLAVRPATPLPWRGAQRLVEVALECARHHVRGQLSAAEFGTGCGAIALALAAFEPRFTRIYALDASREVLATAEANGARYLLNLVISWVEGAGPDAIPEPVDLIICTQAEHAESSDSAGLLKRAQAKLLPGGMLICGFDGQPASLPAAPFGPAPPDAQVWFDHSFDGIVVAIVQFTPHPLAGW